MQLTLLEPMRRFCSGWLSLSMIFKKYTLINNQHRITLKLARSVFQVAVEFVSTLTDEVKLRNYHQQYHRRFSSNIRILTCLSWFKYRTNLLISRIKFIISALPLGLFADWIESRL